MVPGLGKVYTKNYNDALFSFVVIGTAAYPAYSGFSKKGANSIYGWISASLATSLYFGNVYGAYKAAKTYNKKINDAYIKRATDALSNY